MNISLPFALSIVTIGIVLCVGVFLFFHNRNSQHKRGEKPGGLAGPSPD